MHDVKAKTLLSSARRSHGKVRDRGLLDSRKGTSDTALASKTGRRQTSPEEVVQDKRRVRASGQKEAEMTGTVI